MLPYKHHPVFVTHAIKRKVGRWLCRFVSSNRKHLLLAFFQSYYFTKARSVFSRMGSTLLYLPECEIEKSKKKFLMNSLLLLRFERITCLINNCSPWIYVLWWKEIVPCHEEHKFTVITSCVLFYSIICGYAFHMLYMQKKRTNILFR